VRIGPRPLGAGREETAEGQGQTQVRAA
jgi:hypothetical protein